TWRFDGNAWTQVQTAITPDPRSGIVLITTPAGPLLVGGWRADLSRPADTWLFVGGTWVPLAPDANPPGRNWAAMEYDPVRGEAVLFGGIDALWYLNFSGPLIRHD